MRDKTMNLRARRGVRTAIAAALAGLVLASCGVGGEPVENPKLSKGKVTITFNWWGADPRHQASFKAIKLFEKEHPNINVKPVYADWVGYWDRLATSTASGEMPDVNQFDQLYLSSYAERGALLDLSTVQKYLDTSELDPKALEAGRVGKTPYAVPVGNTTNSILINRSLFKKYGVQLPDTARWTWAEFKKAAAELNKASKGKVYGVGPTGSDSFSLNVWARQHGNQLFNSKGEVSLKPSVLASYWKAILGWIKSGAAPSGSHIIEMDGVALDQGDMINNRTGMGFIPSGQFTSFKEGAPKIDFDMADWPSDPDTPKGSQYLKPTMYWAASSSTQHPAEAALFIDFLTNDQRVAKIFGLERGIPGNPAAAKALRATLDKPGKDLMAFSDEMSHKVGDTPPITPKGASDIDAVLKRQYQRVLTGEADPDEAAKTFVGELKDSVDAAS
ncbi:sugar ABC transporter substrate-binding protein [Streptomyces sp. A7024]|uniref:Sugar ABC transporter substrate-binding protein n=1 Tax=Streptomyces coryli TaxID=1128680 RepID=A0A6G4TRF1_9ACTN|nr:sugar ABC transporter substrate-binding protein [Streptomyces coryli]NGN62363.1 sugar ABC transporter substrate-binding protein [Streptomyces coryli]